MFQGECDCCFEAVKLVGPDLVRAAFHLLRGTNACRYTQFTLYQKYKEMTPFTRWFQSSVTGVSQERNYQEKNVFAKCQHLKPGRVSEV